MRLERPHNDGFDAVCSHGLRIALTIEEDGSVHLWDVLVGGENSIGWEHTRIPESEFTNWVRDRARAEGWWRES